MRESYAIGFGFKNKRPNETGHQLSIFMKVLPSASHRCFACSVYLFIHLFISLVVTHFSRVHHLLLLLLLLLVFFFLFTHSVCLHPECNAVHAKVVIIDFL